MKTNLFRSLNNHERRLDSRAFGLLLVLGLAPAGAGCHKHVDESSDALAKVKNTAITEASYRSWWEHRRPAHDTPETRKLILDQLIERSALAQAAREAGLDKDPAVIQEIQNLLIGRLKETRLQPELKALTISEQELRADYQQDLESKFSVPEQTRVAVLWFSTRGEKPLVARYTPRLELARQQAITLPVQEGFGALAIRNTERQSSRYNGGDVGWLEHSPVNDPWKQQVLKIASGLKAPGELSQVVATDQGIFLVRLIERQPAHARPFESVREGIRQRLLSLRRQQMEHRFNQEILARMAVHTFPERLLALKDLPLSKSPDATPGPFRLSAN